MIHNYKETYNSRGYKKITGNIYTTRELTLRNPKNDGNSPLDTKWIKEDYLTIPKGTYVEYKMNEDQMGKFHNISYTKDGVRYVETKLEER